MLTSVVISNYKPFNELSLEHLSRINLIAGMNNVGKTALLEALFLLCGCDNPALIVKINNFRGIVEYRGEADKIRESMWLPLFRNLRTDSPITLKGQIQDGSSLRTEIQTDRGLYYTVPVTNGGGIEPAAVDPAKIGGRLVLTFTYQDKPPQTITLIVDEKGIRAEPRPAGPVFPAFFLASHAVNHEEEARLFGELDSKGEIQSLLPTLQHLEPRLKRLSVILNAGVPMIHGDVGLPRMIPLAQMGDGLRRMTQTFLAMANAPGGVVLVDDIEFGVHHSNIPAVWRSLADASSRYGVQVFATTHSYEWLRGATLISEESFLNDVTVIRLQQRRSGVEAVCFNGETLQAAIRADLEIR